MKLKKYQYITYIMIILSAAIFIATVVLKNISQTNFLELNTQLNCLKFSEDFYGDVQNVKQLAIPYTYFDENTELQLKKIETTGNSDSDLLEKELFEFQKILHSRQQKLIFGFDSLTYSSLVIILIAIIVIIYDLFTAKSESEHIKTVSQEQLKFSRDLHDGVAQDLAALKVYIQKKDDKKADFYADQALKEVRYLIDSMHQDFSLSLSSAITETVSNFETNYNIKTRLLIVSENLDKMETEKQVEILRILHEAFSNIARHANATEVIVQFTEVGNDLKFNIKDNGIGFEKSEMEDSTARKHYGVKNIEERVTALGGTVQFINEGGTTIAITIKDFVR